MSLQVAYEEIGLKASETSFVVFIIGLSIRLLASPSLESNGPVYCFYLKYGSVYYQFRIPPRCIKAAVLPSGNIIYDLNVVWFETKLKCRLWSISSL